jgi:hypothetical protein
MHAYGFRSTMFDQIYYDLLVIMHVKCTIMHGAYV